MINKVHFSHLLFFYLFSMILIGGCKNSSDPGKVQNAPNILLVLADDQSWLHTGATGDKVIKTPAFDRITEEGVLFSNAFAACPSCTPSRTAILSGQEIWRTREAGLLMGAIPKDLKLFSHILRDKGYHVGYTGKGWHLEIGSTLAWTGTHLLKNITNVWKRKSPMG